MPLPKSSASIRPQTENVSKNHIEAPELNPPPSNCLLRFDPDHYDGSFVGVNGFVVAKSSPQLSTPWVRIWSPILRHNFFATGKEAHRLPKFCPVSARQSGKVIIEGTWKPGASNVVPLTKGDVQEDNLGNEPRPQTWGAGKIIKSKFGTTHFSLESNMGMLHNHTNRLPFETGPLQQGSQIPPIGSPVRFQTAYTPGTGRKEGTTQVVSLVYDEKRYTAHAGAVPSPSLLHKIETKICQAHLVL